MWVEPYPDEKLGLEDGYAATEVLYEQLEVLELDFIAASQHLPARQRAVWASARSMASRPEGRGEALETRLRQ